MRTVGNLLLVTGLTLVTAACNPRLDETVVAEGGAATGSVWTVDLVNTFPGRQDEYVRSIEANWANARRLATVRGAVVSYRAFVAPPDSLRGWDVMLMTEYADSAQWENREAIFQEIFASPEFVRVPTPVPSSELRDFAVSGLVLRALVNGR